jgi:hypothetical protein
MEAELHSLHDWFVLNKLTPNKKKCETIFFSNSHNIKKCRDLSVSFCGEKLETKFSVKYLGIYFDSNLSWKKQIKEIRRKINYKLSKIKPLSKFLDSASTFMLIRSFIFPYIHYCSTTWSSASPHLIDKIQSTCDKTLLFSKDIPKIDIKNRLHLDISILTFKAIHQLCPNYVSDQLSIASNIHTYNTRHSSNNNIFHTYTPNKVATQSIKYTSTVVWNSLPNEMKHEKSLVLFKSKCKKFFL